MKPILLLFAAFTFLSLTCRKASNFSLTKNKNQLIALQPLNNFNTSGIETIQKEIASFYNRQVIVLEPKQLPEHFLTKETGLYSADSILKFLSGIKTDRFAEIVGLIDQPLFTIKEESSMPYFDEKIFGMGYQPGNACIVSSARLQTNDTASYNHRLRNVIIHEIGHNLGLGHCTNEQCIMSKENGYFTKLDLGKADYCGECRKKIKL
ncbi:MAG: matrixin family metalloprotease [Lacibacter sp.]